MGLMFLWTSVQYQATVVELDAQLISMDSAQISSGPAEAATILALSSRQINTVAILATVAQLNTRGFSSRGALTLIAILKMTKQAPSPVPVELITGLYSALEAVLSQESNGVK